MPENLNQNPEQKARDIIDRMLIASGWAVPLSSLEEQHQIIQEIESRLSV